MGNCMRCFGGGGGGVSRLMLPVEKVGGGGGEEIGMEHSGLVNDFESREI